jgi:hypothetical protein
VRKKPKHEVIWIAMEQALNPRPYSNRDGGKMPTSLRSNCLVYVLVASLCGTSLALAQPAPSGTGVGPKTARESARERRKALEEESAQKQHRRDEWSEQTLQAVEARDRLRADCRRQAKEQNLHLMKRVRFVRKCMSDGSQR